MTLVLNEALLVSFHQQHPFETAHFESLLSRRDEQTLLVRLRFPSTSERLTARSLSVLLDACLELWSEMSDKTLDRPCESFAQS